ncbi:MAG: ATP-binding protein [Protaetiibacter sp.]
MRNQITATVGHLMWTRGGTVWATWRLAGQPKAFGRADANVLSQRAHQQLFQAIRGEYLLLGLTADLNPVAVVDAMLAGVDIANSPGWAEESLLTLDYLEERPLGKREFWLSAPLRAGSLTNSLLSTGRQLEDYTRDTLALPLRPPSPQEVQAAQHAALQIEEAIPADFATVRATVAEQMWIAGHAQTRGVGIDMPAPTPVDDRTAVGRYQQDAARFTSPSAIPEAVLDEGGQSDLTGRTARLNPLTRRFLKVSSLREETTSYQVMLALASTPKGGWELGLDPIGRLDTIGFPVDWAMRITATKAADVRRRNARAEANLADQMNQQEGTAAITGGGGELDEVAQALRDYHEALNASDKEVEIQVSLSLAIGADNAEEARKRAKFLAKDFQSIEFVFDTPLGGQEALWWAMQPGTPTPRVSREFAEITTGSIFATLLPLTSSDLGDPQGIYFADNITSGTARPVHLDFWGQVQGDVSGSVGIAGEPGGGKSVTVKDLLGTTHDRGGRFVAIDRTELREYGIFAASLDALDTAIADLVDPQFSLDPIRIFGAREGVTHMVTLCSALLGVPARSPEGVMLSEQLSPESAERNGITSAGALLAHLQQLGTTDPTAKSLAGLMGLYSNSAYGRVLFDPTLPPLDLSRRGIVFLTHGMALPDEAEVSNPSLFAEMPLEKLFGRAMYALLARIARQICFANPNEFAAFALDEAAHVTSSPQGLSEITLFLRDGRKHGAVAILASQDARDLGDDITRGLIKNRMLTRQTDAELAASNLEWFQKGFGSDPELVKVVTEQLSPLGADNKVAANRRGEALFRDARGRMGKIRKTVSLRPARRAATLTTPGQATAEVAR